MSWNQVDQSAIREVRKQQENTCSGHETPLTDKVFLKALAARVKAFKNTLSVSGDKVFLKALAARVLARIFCMALLAFEGGVYTVVTVKDFCFWSFGGPFFSVPPGIPFGRAPFSGVLDIAACNSPGVAVVSSFMDPGGADTALIFGFTNVTVGPPYVERNTQINLVWRFWYITSKNSPTSKWCWLWNPFPKRQPTSISAREKAGIIFPYGLNYAYKHTNKTRSELSSTKTWCLHRWKQRAPCTRDKIAVATVTW